MAPWGRPPGWTRTPTCTQSCPHMGSPTPPTTTLGSAPPRTSQAVWINYFPSLCLSFLTWDIRLGNTPKPAYPQAHPSKHRASYRPGYPPGLLAEAPTVFPRK